VAGVLLTTVLLLAVVLALLSYARRKGWLDRWRAGGQVHNRSTEKRFWVVDSQRISRHTTIHTLTKEGERVIVVESSAHVATIVSQMDNTGRDADRGSN
jgi:hypothetical protein